eukprot:TRINITY_DN969_c0_g1_i9.p3 TRINITY_DN969_c0_g1~~TRINITY_DN969_c0_g1_i9.p3  ORF type:complete len:180 (-),score=8.21 TRINITY_DN969_c0_g1_i9:435-911(-)
MPNLLNSIDGTPLLTQEYLHNSFGLRRRKKDTTEHFPTTLCVISDESKFVDNPLDFDPPIQFICPITLKLMVNPITILETGGVCEKSAFLSHIRKGGIYICPVTRMELSSLDYQRNEDLFQEILEWVSLKGKIWRGYDEWLHRMKVQAQERRAFQDIK